MHLFKYRFLCFIRNKTLMFWTLVFPIGLATIFYFAFSDMNNQGKFETIPVAVVDQGNNAFNDVVKQLSSGDTPVLKIQFTNEEKAKQLVQDGDVKAALISQDEPKILYQNETMEVSIIKEIVQSYMRINQTITTIAKDNPNVFNEQVIHEIVTNKVTIQDQNASAGSTDLSVQYFYTILAMTSLYGAFWGLKSMKDIQANQSASAIRLNVAPTHKLKLVWIDYVVAYILMSIEIAIVFAYLVLVLHISFGNQLLLSIGVCLAALSTSLGLGILLGAASKLHENTNIAIISMGSLFSSFLAGMMVNTMPYQINKIAPFIKYINPATLITNSFNIMYYYTDLRQVYINIVILLSIGVISLFIAYQIIRRKSYASL